MILVIWHGSRKGKVDQWVVHSGKCILYHFKGTQVNFSDIYYNDSGHLAVVDQLVGLLQVVGRGVTLLHLLFSTLNTETQIKKQQFIYYRDSLIRRKQFKYL